MYLFLAKNILFFTGSYGEQSCFKNNLDFYNDDVPTIWSATSISESTNDFQNNINSNNNNKSLEKTPVSVVSKKENDIEDFDKTSTTEIGANTAMRPLMLNIPTINHFQPANVISIIRKRPPKKIFRNVLKYFSKQFFWKCLLKYLVHFQNVFSESFFNHQPFHTYILNEQQHI